MTTIVVGAGLIGLTSAYALQARGEQVTLIDARKGVALETSYANGGLVTPSMPEPWNGPGVFGHLAASLFDPRSSMRLRWHAIPSLTAWGLRFLRASTPAQHFAACTDNYRLAAWSLQRTAELTDALGLEYDRGTRGTFSIFRDQKGFEVKEAVCRHVASLGMEYRVLSPGETVAFEPALAAIEDRIHCSVHYPDDHHGDAHRFCRALLPHYDAAGGRVEFDTEVRSLVVDAGGVRGVETSRGDRDASQVVVAAGVHSPAMLSGVGISLPVKPVKGYSVTVETGSTEGLPALPVIDDSMHACLTPFGSRLRMVGTAEFTGFDTRIDPVRTDNLLRLFRELLPDVAARVSTDDATLWAGLRPMSYDGRPFIGATDVQGLFVNSGHGPLGWTMAAGSAELLADVMTGQEPRIDPAPFRLARH